MQTEIERILRSSNNRGYGREKIPNERDREILALIESIASNSEFDDLKATLSREWNCAPVLLAFSERMASEAVRARSTRSIASGFVAAALAQQASDARDHAVVLSLLFHSVSLIGADPIEVLQGVKERVDPAAVVMLDRFVSRSAEDKRIAAMGYRESHDGDGFRYERTW